MTVFFYAVIHGAMKILFVCNMNELRSPTAEACFSKAENLQVKSAGISMTASTRISSELVVWADVILVMETSQRDYILKKFADICPSSKIHSLGIPDIYGYMDERLIDVLRRKVARFLP